MRVMLWGDPRPIDHPMGRIHADLAAMSDIDIRAVGLQEIPCEPYDVLLTWNGLHAGRDRLVPKLREQGKPVVVVERGFFDRMSHSQVDHKGFNHNASWAREFREPFPLRFDAEPMRSRDSGYVLALLQKAHDTQLWDAQFSTPDPFVQAISDAMPDAMPDDLELRIRAHPTQKYDDPRLIVGSLRAALDGARFCITINSNAGNDAIRWGCPVLALGPSVYGYNAVAWEALYIEDLAMSIRSMAAGWTPSFKNRDTGDYCAWLSTKQYNLDDIGAATRTALEKACESA